MRAVEITPLPGLPESVLGVINVHGRVLPVINLRKRCRLPERDQEVDDLLVIARTSRRPVVLPVDSAEVMGPDSGTQTPLEVTVLEEEGAQRMVKKDGELVLVHNLDQLLPVDEEQVLCGVMPSCGAAT